MIYRSNLQCPDLAPHFRLRSPAIQTCGHDMPSDPDFEPDCGYLTHDEAAILYNIAARMPQGRWLDIGARFGWTAAHILMAGHSVTMVDPHFRVPERLERLHDNLRGLSFIGQSQVLADTSREALSALAQTGTTYDGFMIDGNHDAPEPLLDAQGCAAIASKNAVIVFHDTLGQPIHDAASWLVGQGWGFCAYATPNGVSVCWRGQFAAPPHVSDPICRRYAEVAAQ